MVHFSIFFVAIFYTLFFYFVVSVQKKTAEANSGQIPQAI